MLAAPDVARLLALDVRTVRRWCALGILPAVRLAGRWRFPARSIERWLAEVERQAEAAIDGHARVAAQRRMAQR